MGLDIGYHAGNRRHRDVLDRELQDQIDAYMDEYEHRTRERAYFKKQGRGPFQGIPASSAHNHRLHGNSYHGRKIVVDPLDEGRSARSERQASEALANDAAAGDVDM